MSAPSVKRNAILNGIRTISTLVFPLITFPYTSRILGPEGVGKVSFATSFVQYFVLIASLGIPLYGIREIAKVRSDPDRLAETTQELLVLHLASTLVCFLAFLAILPFQPRLSAETVLFLVASATIPLSTLSMEWLYQGLEQYSYITIRSIAFSALSVVAIFVFIHDPQDYVISAAITVAGTLGSSVLNFWNARTNIFRARTVPWEFSRHLKPMLTVYAMNFIISLYINMDTVLLGFLSSPDAVGYYATSMRITKMVMGVVISMGSVILPRLAYFLQQGQRKEFDAMVRKSFAILLLMCLPAVSGLMMLAPEMMAVFAGGKFDAAVLCMQITAPVILIIGVSNLLGFQILYPLGKDRLVVLSVSIGAIVSLALNALLIPRMAHLGAAIATVTAETMVIVAQVILIRRNYDLPMPWGNVARYVAGTGAMCLALWGAKGLVSHQGIRLIVAVPVGAAIYFAVVAALRDDFLLDNMKVLRSKVFPHA